MWGGVFVADPADGYPRGTPEGMPEHLSWHGTLHAIAPAVAGVALVSACLVFARRFAGLRQRGWAAYSAATAVVYLILGFAALPAEDFRLMLAGGALIWGWASIIALRLMTDR